MVGLLCKKKLVLEKKGLLCKKKGPKRDHFSRTKKEKGPFQQDKKEKKDFCVKKGPKKDHFSSLVLKRTKSLIKDLYVSTV